jgi:hypothetical protein
MKTIKKIGLVALTLLALASPTLAQNNLNGFLKGQYNTETHKVEPQLNTFYTLPGGISGYTFIDFNDGNYFAKSILKKNIGYGISIRSENVSSNETFTATGNGLEAKIPFLPENVSVSANYLPIWIDNDGKQIDKQIAGFGFEVKLPAGFTFSGFGNKSLTNGQWGYGELNLSHNAGPVNMTYNPQLVNDGDGSPDLVHRIGIEIPFK